MSFDRSREAWSVPDLDAPSRLVLLALADIADDAGECWPSIAHLAEKTGLGERSIRTRLADFEACGLVSRVRRHRTDGTLGTYRYTLHLAAPDAASPPAPGAAHEPITTSEPISSSSLRSEEALNRQVARGYWEWYIAEHPGLKPTIGFLPLCSVAKNLLKSGHQPDDIIDAMKTARSWTSKSLSDEIARKRALAEERTTTVAVPHAIVRAFAKAEPFFDRHRTGATKEERQHWMRLATTLRHSGYDIGETMIRLALALRADWITTWSLQNIECPRFPGELDDYADSMERAWTNRRWNVS